MGNMTQNSYIDIFKKKKLYIAQSYHTLQIIIDCEVNDQFLRGRLQLKQSKAADPLT